jgi:microcystin degradation protein MlrC
MAQALDIAVFYREFPHVDFYERAEKLIGLVDRTLKGEIAPRLATYDCRMIDVLPTSREPMKSFVEKLRRIEREDDRVLDIGVVHGFRAADVPEMGTKVVVLATAITPMAMAWRSGWRASCSTTTAARCRRC